jgi:hypothetical protein
MLTRTANPHKERLLTVVTGKAGKLGIRPRDRLEHPLRVGRENAIAGRFSIGCATDRANNLSFAKAFDGLVVQRAFAHPAFPFFIAARPANDDRTVRAGVVLLNASA